MGQGWETIKSRLHLAPARAVLGQGWGGGGGFRGSKLTIPQIVRQQGNKQIKKQQKKKKEEDDANWSGRLHTVSPSLHGWISPRPLCFLRLCVLGIFAVYLLFFYIYLRVQEKNKNKQKKKVEKNVKKGEGRGNIFFFFFFRISPSQQFVLTEVHPLDNVPTIIKNPSNIFRIHCTREVRVTVVPPIPARCTDSL